MQKIRNPSLIFNGGIIHIQIGRYGSDDYLSRIQGLETEICSVIT